MTCCGCLSCEDAACRPRQLFALAAASPVSVPTIDWMPLWTPLACTAPPLALEPATQLPVAPCPETGAGCNDSFSRWFSLPSQRPAYAAGGTALL